MVTIQLAKSYKTFMLIGPEIVSLLSSESNPNLYQSGSTFYFRDKCASEETCYSFYELKGSALTLRLEGVPASTSVVTGSSGEMAIYWTYPLAPGNFLVPAQLNLAVLTKTETNVTKVPVEGYYSPMIADVYLSTDGSAWAAWILARDGQKSDAQYHVYSYANNKFTYIDMAAGSSSLNVTWQGSNGLLSLEGVDQSGLFKIGPANTLDQVSGSVGTHSQLITDTTASEYNNHWITYNKGSATAPNYRVATWKGGTLTTLLTGIEEKPTAFIDGQGQSWLSYQVDGTHNLARLKSGEISVNFEGFDYITNINASPGPNQDMSPWGFHGSITDSDGNVITHVCSLTGGQSGCSIIPLASFSSVVNVQATASDNAFWVLNDNEGTTYLWRNIQSK